MELSFQEKEGRLANRIRANKLFANFDLASWISEAIGDRRWESVLDIGCGNGNHLGIYLRHRTDAGRVVGLDRDATLLDEARSRYANTLDLELVEQSMDKPLPFEDGAFDLVMSVFAIYNAQHPVATVQEIHRVMRPGGRLILVGPTVDNAKELYEFNERSTGQRIDQRTLLRSARLADEFLPAVREIFDKCRDELLDSHLTFPDQNEFLRYYTSTLLYEETAKNPELSHAEMEAACPTTHNLRLSKQTLAITASKR